KNPRAGDIDFERLMIVVSQAISQLISETEPRENHLAEAKRLFNEYLTSVGRKGLRIPPKMISDVNRSLESLRAVHALVASSKERGIDPTVAYLLLQNFEHLRETKGPDVARKVIEGTLRVFTRKQRGRPRTIPLVMLLRAKKAHDTGQSYAQIAI